VSEDLRPRGKRIVGVFVIAVLVILAIFIIGDLVTSLTGHSDQIMAVFAADIIIVGAITIAAIVFSAKKSVK
jgi:lipopolysaccharide export LptBFGC system permease protein LptF